MIKSKLKSSKSKLLKLCVAFLLPFSLMGGIASFDNISLAENSADYVYYYEENVNVTNSSFTEGSTPYASGNSLSGWEAIETTSNAKGMIIDVGSGTTTDEDSSTSTFSTYQNIYMLQSNPNAKGSDSRILMINSKQNENSTNVYASKGYRSNSITLEANSYYRFSVSVKTMLNGDESASASIYVSGLVDNDGNAIEVGTENITSNIWKEYYIFIATGDSSQTVTIDLYLGSNDNIASTGVVFFDDINVNRYSENAFYESCFDFGYTGVDNYKDLHNTYSFLVDGLKNKSSLIDTSNYNFNFEDEINSYNTLGDAWTKVESSNGHAIIADIRNMQPSYFKDLTGYTYIGDDLSYNNKQAMLLYTDENGGYVGVQSKDFDIKAHGIYKISVNIKVAEISNGSFYIKLQENDNIYNLYSNFLTDDENDSDSSKQYIALQNGQTSGYSSNTDNNFTNDYQTVEFYLKGHSLYDSSINIQLWLGDSSTSATGCVVVDNITVEYADYEDFSAASNSLELLSFSSTPSSIPNSYFNSTEFSGDSMTYPITASDWTSEIENENYNESGVIYLYTPELYREMYYDNYSWAGIYPGNPFNYTDIDFPNNIYMMYNSKNSYQSITSSSYSLSSNSYYKLSFDFYNQNGIGNVNPSQIKVEVIDENGITLFSQDGISSNSNWDNMEIYFHTAETVSHNIQLKISLGDEDNKVGGLVYLDNVIVETSDEATFNSENAYYKADLTDYYLNLTVNGEASSDITSSPAYNLSVDTIYDSNLTEDDKIDCASAGIVSGKNNPYGEDLKIEDSNYLAIQTKYACNATLTSSYTLSLEADNYYKLTFDLATIFNIGADKADSDGHDCKYGVSVSIEGFDDITEIVNAGQLKNYSIYLKCTEAVTPTISFTLVSDCNETLGLALITHLDFTSIEETEYTNASLSQTFGKTSFIANQNESEDDSTDDDTSDDSTTDDTTDNSAWLLIPSLIFGLAIIVAIIGFALRKIKIKKIEKIKKENYDRKLSINHDVILIEAQKRRDKEVADLMKAKKLLENDRIRMEEEHKEFVKSSQLNNKGKISREMEKELKSYNLNIIRIDEKINIIKEKIDTVMSAEYLLSIERKIVAEEDEAFRKEKRAYKEQLKDIKAQQIQENNDKQDNN